MPENGMEVLESIKASVIPTASHADTAKALHVGGGDVF